jgi:hypothetical protein
VTLGSPENSLNPIDVHLPAHAMCSVEDPERNPGVLVPFGHDAAAKLIQHISDVQHLPVQARKRLGGVGLPQRVSTKQVDDGTVAVARLNGVDIRITSTYMVKI